jgi:hypothetical protein
MLYQKPEQILRELGISEPPEIEIETIAQHCGATIVYESLTGCEARIIGVGDRAIITVNSNSAVERQRFSGGHELGHWMWDRGDLRLVACSDQAIERWSGNEKEIQANEFSASLLLPDFMFRPRAKDLPVTFSTVRKLSSVFRTSFTATAFKIVDIGMYPAALVCFSKSGRKWFRLGPDIPKWLFPTQELNKLSVAYELLEGGQITAEPTEMYSNIWFAHPSGRSHTLIEDSRMISQDTVLSLLWWKDQSQIVQIS